MGLDTLDEFSPKDTDPVSLGDDAIRLTRAATKQSVGLEHYLDGAHKIPNGPQSSRPAAGRVGRVYFNTDTSGMEYDNGVQWITYNSARALAAAIYNPTTRAYPGGVQEVVMPSIWIDNATGLSNPSYNQVHAPSYDCWVILAGRISVDGAGGFGHSLSIEAWGGSSWYPVGTIYDMQATVLTLSIFQPASSGEPFRLTYTNATPGTRNMSWASLSLGILGAV